MFDHVTFGVADLTRSTVFYDRALAPLGFRRLLTLSASEAGGVRLAAYGETRPQLWLAEERAIQGMLHIALSAGTRPQVDAFHVAACAAGGADNGPPGLRPQYGAGYYAAFVLDPDGHNIEAVCLDAGDISPGQG